MTRPHVRAVIQRLQTTGCCVIIACTHTHHGPDMLGLWGPDTNTSGVDQAYLDELQNKLAAVISAALEDMRPSAGMKAGCVQVKGMVKNARNAYILDEELTILQFFGHDHQMLASLFSFPCHPEVLREHNPYITSDYPGVLRCHLKQRFTLPFLFWGMGRYADA